MLIFADKIKVWKLLKSIITFITLERTTFPRGPLSKFISNKDKEIIKITGKANKNLNNISRLETFLIKITRVNIMESKTINQHASPKIKNSIALRDAPNFPITFNGAESVAVKGEGSKEL